MKRDIKFILLLDGSPLAKLVSTIASGDFAGGITGEFFAGFNLIALVLALVEDRGATQERTNVSVRGGIYCISLRTRARVREGELSLNRIKEEMR